MRNGELISEKSMVCSNKKVALYKENTDLRDNFSGIHLFHKVGVYLLLSLMWFFPMWEIGYK